MTDLDYYHALELTAWQRREPPSPLNQHPATNHLLADLRIKVAACTACDLHQTRTQTVFGVGNENADLMIIGEAPGFYEDKAGEPFVGKAGQLLNAMLKAIQLTREEIYIANILKSRPPQNRDPLAAEVKACTPFLNEQINIIKPRLLVAVGRISAHFLLSTKASLESLRSKVHTHAPTNTPLIVTYHPAYLLRNPIDKRKAYADLLFIREKLASLQERASLPFELTPSV